MIATTIISSINVNPLLRCDTIRHHQFSFRPASMLCWLMTTGDLDWTRNSKVNQYSEGCHGEFWSVQKKSPEVSPGLSHLKKATIIRPCNKRLRTATRRTVLGKNGSTGPAVPFNASSTDSGRCQNQVQPVDVIVSALRCRARIGDRYHTVAAHCD